MIRFRAAVLRVLLPLAALGAAPLSPAQEVIAVISPPPGPYEAAHRAFVAEMGRDVPAVRLPGRLRAARARVVVAFGGQAAVQSIPETSTLIVCLAPGLAKRLSRSGGLAHIAMRPAPDRLLSELRRVQPGLRRLAVLSDGLDSKAYISGLERAGSGLGIRIIAPRASGRDGVPGALRSLLAEKADAVWLAPDPGLVTPENFQTIAQFSWDNDIPFYAPTRGLAAAGAAGAVSVGPEEAGRTAAELARRALAGEALPELVYPTRTGIVVSLASARKAGLALAPNTLDKDIEVLP